MAELMLVPSARHQVPLPDGLEPSVAAPLTMRPEVLELAKRHGAGLGLISDDSTVEAIREATGGRGADVVIDCVGSDATRPMGAASARQMGDPTVVGIGRGTLGVSFFSVPYEVAIRTTYRGSRPELVEVLSDPKRRHHFPPRKGQRGL